MGALLIMVHAISAAACEYCLTLQRELRCIFSQQTTVTLHQVGTIDIPNMHTINEQTLHSSLLITVDNAEIFRYSGTHVSIVVNLGTGKVAVIQRSLIYL